MDNPAPLEYYFAFGMDPSNLPLVLSSLLLIYWRSPLIFVLFFFFCIKQTWKCTGTADAYAALTLDVPTLVSLHATRRCLRTYHHKTLLLLEFLVLLFNRLSLTSRVLELLFSIFSNDGSITSGLMCFRRSFGLSKENMLDIVMLPPLMSTAKSNYCTQII